MTSKRLQSYIMLHTALEFEEWVKCVRENLLWSILEMKTEKVTRLDVVCFLLGNSPTSEVYMPTFRNTLFHLHRQVGVCRILHTTLARTDLAASPWQSPVSNFRSHPAVSGEKQICCHPPHRTPVIWHPVTSSYFQKMKLKLKGSRFDTIEEIQADSQRVHDTMI
jgi:hypothetical protein